MPTDQTKYREERKALRAAIRAQGYVAYDGIKPRDLRAAAKDPRGFGLKRINQYPEFTPYDFTGVTPKPGALVRWKSAEQWRRAAVKGEGRFVEVAPDGRFRIRYTMAFPSGYASKIISVHPKYITDYRED